jgi:hypothetical protein
MKKDYYPTKNAMAALDANLLGPCGFNCSFCLAYKDKKCLGCRYQAQRSEEKGLTPVFCDTLVCATAKGFKMCADCADYPCKKYDDSIFSEKFISYIRKDIKGA